MIERDWVLYQPTVTHDLACGLTQPPTILKVTRSALCNSKYFAFLSMTLPCLYKGGMNKRSDIKKPAQGGFPN